jgi:MarR family transcriptional regulator, organic hydroperoxide resistance regulator
MEHFNIDNAGGYLIELAEQSLKKKLIKKFRDHDIPVTPFQWVVLYRLWQKDRQTQAELSSKTFRDYPSMTRVVDGLEKQGFIIRESNKSDRRSNIVCLTEKGREMEQVLPPIVEEHLHEALIGIDRDELEIMKKCLKTICANLAD